MVRNLPLVIELYLQTKLEIEFKFLRLRRVFALLIGFEYFIQIRLVRLFRVQEVFDIQRRTRGFDRKRMPRLQFA